MTEKAKPENTLILTDDWRVDLPDIPIPSGDMTVYLSQVEDFTWEVLCKYGNKRVPLNKLSLPLDDTQFIRTDVRHEGYESRQGYVSIDGKADATLAIDILARLISAYEAKRNNSIDEFSYAVAMITIGLNSFSTEKKIAIVKENRNKQLDYTDDRDREICDWARKQIKHGVFTKREATTKTMERFTRSDINMDEIYPTSRKQYANILKKGRII